MRISRLLLAAFAILAVIAFVVTEQLISASSPELGQSVRIEPVGDSVETTPPTQSEPTPTASAEPTAAAPTPAPDAAPDNGKSPAAKKVTPHVPQAGIDDDDGYDDDFDADDRDVNGD